MRAVNDCLAEWPSLRCTRHWLSSLLLPPMRRERVVLARRFIVRADRIRLKLVLETRLDPWATISTQTASSLHAMPPPMLLPPVTVSSAVLCRNYRRSLLCLKAHVEKLPVAPQVHVGLVLRRTRVIDVPCQGDVRWWRRAWDRKRPEQGEQWYDQGSTAPSSELSDLSRSIAAETGEHCRSPCSRSHNCTPVKTVPRTEAPRSLMHSTSRWMTTPL